MLHRCLKDVAWSFCGPQGEAIGAAQFVRQKLDDLAVWRHAEHAAVRQLLAWIVEELWESEWRIGEIQRSIRSTYQIVTAVELLAFLAISQHRQLTIGLPASHTPIS